MVAARATVAIHLNVRIFPAEKLSALSSNTELQVKLSNYFGREFTYWIFNPVDDYFS